MRAATPTHLDRPPFGQQVVVSALSLLFSLAVLLAGSPTVHDALHTGADDPGHVCLVVILGQGHIEGPNSPALLIQPASVHLERPQLALLTLAWTHWRPHSPRAPPFLA